jgi:hypothetical protein
MKIETLPTGEHITRNRGLAGFRSTILRAVAKFALRCALASLAPRWHAEPSAVKENPETNEVFSKALMAKASFHQQLHCDCTSCRCELIVTAFREELVCPTLHAVPIARMKSGIFHAVCEPFTSTEIELLNTNDEEYIESAYPNLAHRIQKEIEARYRNQAHTGGRERGMFCTTATRH